MYWNLFWGRIYKGDDVTHQFSNKISGVIGDKLKQLYRNQSYNKLDLPNIEMSSKGMGSGKVAYYLKIPFSLMYEKCDAYTSFDHVGGRDHKPALNQRKRSLNKVLLSNEVLDISYLKSTPEGLLE